MKVRNRPCEMGEKAGKNLARFADKAEQDWRESMGFVPQRCESCAYRDGTFPNRCLTTQADALKCTMERIPFYCHQGVDLKHPELTPPKSLCAGWMLLHDAKPPTEMPWKFSDEYGDQE